MLRSILSPRLLILCLTCTAWADASPVQAQPVQAPAGLQMGSRTVDLVVEIDEKTTVPRLIIPANLLVAQKTRTGVNVGMLGHISTGIALSCALVSCGCWLVRRSKGRALALLLLTACLCTAGVSLVWADIPGPNGERPDRSMRPFPPITPPLPPAQPPAQVTLPAGIEFSGKLVLEVVPEGDKVKLIVAKTMVKPSANVPKTIGWD